MEKVSDVRRKTTLISLVLLISYFKQKGEFWKKVPRKLRNEISPAKTSYRTYGITTLHLSTRFPHPLSMQLRLCIHIILIYVLHFQDIWKLPRAFVRDHFPRKVNFVQIYHTWNFDKESFQYRAKSEIRHEYNHKARTAYNRISKRSFHNSVASDCRHYYDLVRTRHVYSTYGAARWATLKIFRWHLTIMTCARYFIAHSKVFLR